jgi:hypothetical protein
MNAVTRRLELLKLEGLGFSQVEIVKELSQKANCSPRTIYNDFETRQSWQLGIENLNPKNLLMKTINRLDQIYRQGSIRLLTFQTELGQIGALNIMLKANKAQFEMALLPELIKRVTALEKKAERGVFVP